MALCATGHERSRSLPFRRIRLRLDSWDGRYTSAAAAAMICRKISTSSSIEGYGVPEVQVPMYICCDATEAFKCQ